MKYITFLLSIFLVACSVTKPIKKAESDPIEVNLMHDTDSVKNDSESNLLTSEPRIDKLEIINPSQKSIIKPTKLKIIEIKQRNKKTKINDGHVAYHIPTIMTVRDTYQVSLVISKTTVNIYEDFEGVVKTTTIPITETMEVKLIDPSPMDDKTFSIVPDNEAEQLVEDGDEVTKWSWNVTPLKSGGANLKLVVAIIKNGNRKETVYQDNVRIKTNPGKTIPLFLGKYWQWFLSTLVIPFGIWLYNKKNKKENETE